jgi:RNA polymerase sigma-70 factor (ECF subfamily)
VKSSGFICQMPEECLIDSDAATNPGEVFGSDSWERGEALTPALLGRLYDAYFHRLYNYLSYRTASREEAEDLAGQVFERVIAKYHTFDPKRGAFESWIFTIARNLLSNQKRHQKRHPEQELGEWLEGNEATSPDLLFLRQEELRRLHHYLTRLSDRDRELIALRFGANLNQRRIGELLGMNEPTVAVALGRAVRRLRQMFENDEQPGEINPVKKTK